MSLHLLGATSAAEWITVFGEYSGLAKWYLHIISKYIDPEPRSIACGSDGQN